MPKRRLTTAKKQPTKKIKFFECEARVIPPRKGYDYLAPDGSEIQEEKIEELKHSNCALCTLPPDKTTIPVKHRTIEEIWFVASGIGEVWLNSPNGHEKIFEIQPGSRVTIPTGTAFQFRNTGQNPLKIHITCIPKWPGPSEAIQLTRGKWIPTVDAQSLANEQKFTPKPK